MIEYRHIAGAILPLRLIFWGGLLVVLDFTISQTTTRTVNNQVVSAGGFRFDVLNDAVGLAMILWAVVRLRRVPVSDAYRGVMTFVVIMTVYSLAEAVVNHVVFVAPEPLALLGQAIGLAQLAAILMFCLSMVWLCTAAGLIDAAKLWQITLWLFVIIYALPLGLLHLAGMLAMLTGSGFSLDLGAAGLLLLPVFIVPLVMFFVATSRMRRAAGALAAA